MFHSDDPVKDQANYYDYLERRKRRLTAVLKIYNLLNDKDRIINVTVVQDGSFQFEITKFETIGDFVVTEEFVDWCGVLAIEIARNTPEKEWDYVEVV